MMRETENNLLVVSGLKKHFLVSRFGLSARTMLKAVDGVDLKIPVGKTVGLVGESGCGKSTLSRLVLRLIEATEGEILFNGSDIRKYNRTEMKNIRKDMQIIFQDPFSSLDPKMKVGKALAEPLIYSKQYRSRSDIKQRVMQLLDMVGLDQKSYNRYPHEFSGGQRQRICISRALATSPKLVICDEPVSALDVSMRSQVLNLMKDLQKQRELSYLFITHDLSVARYISDYMSLMYLGQIVESADKEGFFNNPLHPYAKLLMASVMVPDPDYKHDVVPFTGEMPNPVSPPAGCRFHPRCRYCTDICRIKEPECVEAEPNHFVMCHLYSGCRPQVLKSEG